METIFTKIKDAVKKANIPGINYKEGYPMDMVELDESLVEDESSDTITPLVSALEVITKTVKENATPEDDVRVCFGHLPGEEEWFISIGDMITIEGSIRKPTPRTSKRAGLASLVIGDR